MDGDDGRTYILELAPHGGMINVMRRDMKYQHAAVHDSDPRYATLCELFTVPT